MTLDFSRAGAPAHLARQVALGEADGFASFQLRAADGGAVPLGNLVSVAGLVEACRARGLEVLGHPSLGGPSQLLRANVLRPGSLPPASPQGALGRVWRFDEGSHYDTVSALVSAVRGGAVVARGVLPAFELCLNEVTDNVLNHSAPSSGEAFGFVAVRADAAGAVEAAVFDTGRGIPATLAAHPGAAAPSDAIDLALERGVTDGRGAGNGLWVVSRLAGASGGALVISSGGARRSLSAPGAAPVRSKVTGRIPGSTLVCFSLDARRPVDLPGAIGGHEPADLWLERREEGGGVRLDVALESRGTGTRVAAREMRTVAANVLGGTDAHVVLDFSGVGVASTSYLDELLDGEVGAAVAAGRASLAGMNPDCLAALRAVAG